MIVISPIELRGNLKKYLDLAETERRKDYHSAC